MTTNVKALHGSNAHVFWIAFATSSLVLFLIAAVALLAFAPGVVFAARPVEPASRPVSYAAASIAKPTYTPSPMPSPTATLLPTATAEPATAQPAATDITMPIDTSIEMSIVTDSSAPAPQAQPDTSTGKSILVSISQQHMWVYQDGQEVYSFVVSTGMHNATRAGSFSVLDKIPNAYGSTWNIWMPDWMGIYYAGSLENGIHALPILPSGATLWAGFLGTPISYGCVVLGTWDAEQLYNWAEVGVPVNIRW
jgi:lipoprotein-anchoring transpeptidase ErfK/SrfK